MDCAARRSFYGEILMNEFLLFAVVMVYLALIASNRASRK
jgi:hypothetical protein